MICRTSTSRRLAQSSMAPPTKGLTVSSTNQKNALTDVAWSNAVSAARA